MLKEGVVKIFTSKMSISRNGLDSENAIGDGEEGYIESSTSKIEDQDILLLGRFGVEAVCNGCSSGLVDDTEDM